jgi:RNA polymerase sigma factor (sigma-70 family)
MENFKPTFEDSIEIIDSEISKRRHRWHLTAISWMDFEDVAQKLRLHIYKKWDQWKHELPLRPWLNQVINNQMTNILRNNYSNYSRPCLKCKFYLGDNHCQLYSIQSNACKDYAKWEKTKKSAYDIKFPISLNTPNYQDSEYTIENTLHHSEELSNIENVLPAFHEVMKKNLNNIEWKVYDYMFIQNLEEDEIAKRMGYKLSYKDGRLAYRQISKIKSKILKKAKLAVSEVI